VDHGSADLRRGKLLEKTGWDRERDLDLVELNEAFARGRDCCDAAVAPQPRQSECEWRRGRAGTSDRASGARILTTLLRNAAAQRAPRNRRAVPRRRQCRRDGCRAITLALNVSIQFDTVGARHAVPLQFTMMTILSKFSGARRSGEIYRSASGFAGRRHPILARAGLRSRGRLSFFTSVLLEAVPGFEIRVHACDLPRRMMRWSGLRARKMFRRLRRSFQVRSQPFGSEAIAALRLGFERSDLRSVGRRRRADGGVSGERAPGKRHPQPDPR